MQNISTGQSIMLLWLLLCAFFFFNFVFYFSFMRKLEVKSVLSLFLQNAYIIPKNGNIFKNIPFTPNNDLS